MRFFDRLRVSSRHIRGRLVESILVVLATAVGVALVAAMAAFIRSYNQQTEYLLSHPAYRELLVESVGNETELDEPAVEYDPATTSEASLGYNDVGSALENTSLVTYGYIADREQLSTQGFGGRGGGGFARGIAPPAGSEPLPGPGTESARDATGTGRPAEPSQESGTPDVFAAVRDSMREAAENSEPFDLEQFFGTDDDVLTELPMDSFPGRSVTADFFEAYGLAIAEGSAIAEEDTAAGNQVIVLGSDLAQTLFPDGGAVGTRIRLNLQTYTVVGILSPSFLSDTETGTSFNDVAFVPNGEAQVSFGGTVIRLQRPTRTLRFAVGDSANLEAAMSELEAHFDTEYGEGAVRITAPLDELAAERDKLGRILSVVLFLAAAGLFIASINLFNLMLMRVIKRTRGVGISRALGATRGDVSRQFLNESAFMSLIGALIGLAAAPFVYNLLSSALVAEISDTAAMSWTYMLIGAAGAFLFTVVFGVYPAYQAGRVDAALAIKTE